MHLLKTRLAPIAVAVIGVVAGLFLSAGPAAAATHHITISTYSYHPASLTITAGDTVTWTNLDSVGHDVTITRGPVLFHSPLLAKGQSWSYTFQVAGPYDYICSVHPDMKATVTVQAAPAVATTAAPATTHHAAAHKTVAKAAAASPAAVAAPASVPSSPTSSRVNPLLLVSGALVAVLVFCLLVMASRPHPVAVEEPVVEDEADAVASVPPPPPLEMGASH